MAMNSPLSSILKTSSLNSAKRNVSQVRFDSAATLDVVGILKDHIDGRNNDKYGLLLGLKKDPNVNDAFLMLILQQVNKSISVLVPKVEVFVDALLSVSWIQRPKPVVEEYLIFVQALLSAHSYYCKPVVWMLVSNLSLTPVNETASNNIHEVLKGILHIMPLSRGIVLEALSDCFPYFKKETAGQLNYVRNLLKVSDYCPMSRTFILNIVIGRLVKLDSSVPREELLKSITNKTEFEMDAASSQITETLDKIMEIMFELCEVNCKADWETHRQFYTDMYSVFESLILPACGIHHTHFLMFYICSTKSTLYEAFIERLWNMFQNPSSPLNIRKSAADYLASFLGKAKFVPLKIVTFCLEKVCQWIHAYLDRQSKGEGAAVFKTRAHIAFYTACHIPFYVIAARHDDFLDNKKLMASLHTLDLARIVGSALNPLRYCHPTTVRQFAESASHLQVVFCHTIVVHNQRLCIPETNSESFVMDTEYPFEKYLLQTSLRYITPLIIEKPIGRDDSFYDSDQVMEELISESPRGGGYMHHFLG